MRDFISSRARAIPPSGIRKFFDLAQNMEGVISLGVGEPDFSTPWKVCEASIYSIEHGRTHYTSNKGIQPLREMISRNLSSRYGLSYDSEDEIIITTGVSEGFDIAVRAVVDPGDEVLVAEPSYVAYSPCVTLSGGVPVPVPCRAEDDFRLSADALMERITPRTKALIINYPNNPTGAIMGREGYSEIADVVSDHDLLLISDEVYSDLTYEGSHIAAATVKDLWERTITLNGFSKAYAMTGWRIGYLCAPPAICAAALKIHQYIMLCAPIMGQMAAVEALRTGEEELKAMVREYRLRRNLFVNGLNTLGLSCHLPEGALYAFPSVKNTGLSDFEFAERLLTEQRVAAVPGSVFGEAGRDRLRCSYAVSREEILTALKRIGAFISDLEIPHPPLVQ
jgi:aminotransferase